MITLAFETKIVMGRGLQMYVVLHFDLDGI